MGVATRCGCKEVYRFPHTTYPYSSCICSFLQQHPYFQFIFLKCFSFFIILYMRMTKIISMLFKSNCNSNNGEDNDKDYEQEAVYVFHSFFKM